MTLFSENLNTTDRPYEMDEDGRYCFNFTYADVNNYIKENIDGANDFTDVVKDGYVVAFEVAYDDAEPYSEEYNAFIKPDGMILFDPVEDEDDDVYVDYGELEVIMYDGWKDDMFMDFMIRNDTSGRIVINLNENEVFNKTLSDLPGVIDVEDADFNHYYITFNNLTADLKEGTYLILVHGTACWDGELPRIVYGIRTCDDALHIAVNQQSHLQGICTFFRE